MIMEDLKKLVLDLKAMAFSSMLGVGGLFLDLLTTS